jgi:hypothetical protein
MIIIILRNTILRNNNKVNKVNKVNKFIKVKVLVVYSIRFPHIRALKGYSANTTFCHLKTRRSFWSMQYKRLCKRHTRLCWTKMLLLVTNQHLQQSQEDSVPCVTRSCCSDCNHTHKGKECISEYHQYQDGFERTCLKEKSAPGNQGICQFDQRGNRPRSRHSEGSTNDTRTVKNSINEYGIMGSISKEGIRSANNLGEAYRQIISAETKSIHSWCRQADNEEENRWIDKQ